MRGHRARAAIAGLVALSLLAAACGDDDEGGEEASATTEAAAAETTITAEATETTAAPETTEAPTTTVAAEPLTILVTNDDGVGAEGIDVLVETLRTLPDVEIVVFAPAENQSGSSDRFTEGGGLVVTETTTASGYPATSVAGFPADAVIQALDLGGMTEMPDLVVSGINEGQNIGPFATLSGTVGAARTAARRGIPALAVSAGTLVQADGSKLSDFESAAEAVLEWVETYLEDVAAGEYAEAPITVWNINTPTCTAGEPRGLIEAPLATDVGERPVLAPDCTSTLDSSLDDVDAFVNGSSSLTIMDIDALDALLAEIAAG
jgi:5'-nucleotidase